MASCLSKLCAFIGVPYIAPQQADRRVNLSLPDASLHFIRRLNYLHKTEIYPFPILDIGMLYRLLKRLITKVVKSLPAEPHRFSGELPAEIFERFDATTKGSTC